MKLDEAKELLKKEMQQTLYVIEKCSLESQSGKEQWKKEAQAIETVLQELERLQKENEELKYLYNKALTDVVVGVDLDNTYIRKEKIMKYKKEAENTECKSALEAICIGAIIGVLDGLLEG